MKDKIERHRAIMRILGARRVGSQGELLSLLREEGIASTQATLSRDLKAMKIAKMHAATGEYFYAVPEDLRHVVPETDAGHTMTGILHLDISGCFCVFRTRPGYANMLGAILDGNMPTGAMGTVAGDDTLLMIMREGTSHAQIVREMEVFLPGISQKLLNPIEGISGGATPLEDWQEQ